jgi:tripartite-type tricarboxylate transporter receptor subunit TctC
MRVLADEASAKLGQPVVIVNRPGAAGSIVGSTLKNAAADGYTIGQLPITALRYSLMHKVGWDPLADFTPILQVSGTTFGLLVPTSSPWTHPQELVEFARRHPNELTVGSTGIGSTPHLALENLLTTRGVSYTHVPYKGTADQMLALANGALMAGVNSTGFAPWVEQGKLRVLALFSETRSARWPQVPTMKELGFSDASYYSPWGLVAPNGTPTAVITQLHDAFKAATQSARHAAELAKYDQLVAYLDASAYKASLARTLVQERALLQRLGLLLEQQRHDRSKP